MPLTEKGQEIRSNMEREYGPEKGERVFYASKNAGTIHGVDAPPRSGGLREVLERPNPALEELNRWRKEDETRRVREGESALAELNKHYYGAHDAVPVAPCYGRDQSWPPLDPTSIGEVPNYGGGGQPSGMREPADAAPQPGEPGHEARELAVAHELEAMHGEDATIGRTPGSTAHSSMVKTLSKIHGNPSEAEKTERSRKEKEAHYNQALQEGRITGHEHRGFMEAIRGGHADTSFDQAMAGYFGGAPDFSGDARSALGGAPEVVTQRQMANFASNFNYGQKGSPY